MSITITYVRKGRGAALAAALALACGLLLAAPAALAQVLPAPLTSAALRESGAGTFRYFGFHVYDARLWVSGDRYDAAAPFALGLRYARNFTGAAIAGSSIEEMRRVGITDAGDLARWDTEMKRVFPDIKPGDELVGMHRPRRGVEFFHNGRAIGVVNDTAFAAAFFAIWLDPRTRAGDLRTALLGQPR
jgi:Chalcone isomerase-like